SFSFFAAGPLWLVLFAASNGKLPTRTPVSFFVSLHAAHKLGLPIASCRIHLSIHSASCCGSRPETGSPRPARKSNFQDDPIEPKSTGMTRGAQKRKHRPCSPEELEQIRTRR